MRRLLVLAVAAASAVVVAPPAVVLAAPPGAVQPAEYRPVRGPSAPAEHRFLQKTHRGEELPRHAYDLAAAEATRLPTSGGRWSMIGPTNIGGRIVDLALDPQRSDTVYAAAASGGLWRSTDAGATFETAWPDDLTQAMGSVAAAPDGTLYVGTGEANPGGGSVTYTGTGLYRSTDRGRSWANVGLRDSGAIGGIVIDPRDPRRIFAAASGSLFNPGGDRGVYLSTDAGRSWARVLAPANETTGATEVMFDPHDPLRMYAVLWDHIRRPEQRSYSGTGSGVYRSTDGGVSWSRLDGLAPPAADLGRIGLGLAPSQPNLLYAVVGRGELSVNRFGGFFASTDGGDTWTRMPETQELLDSQSTFAWWFGKVWVNPDDARNVHFAGVPLVTTRDGGRTWTFEDDTIHVDHHAMVWDPRYPSRVYLGNDGGVYRSDQDGNGGWVKSTYQPFMQFYSAAITPQDTSRVSGGTQDNGSLRSWGGPDFNEYAGGDGEENLINPTDRNNVFACYQYGNCFRSVDGGDTTRMFSDDTTSDRRNWFTPLQFDPTDPDVMYYGGNRLNRSTDNGLTWTPISPDLTGGPGQDTYPYGTISTVAAAPSDPRTLYVGTDDGRVWISRDLGASWRLVLSGQPWVTRVAVDERDARTVYVTLSGYRSASYRPHVMVSRNAGSSWTDLSGNLPQAPVNDVVLGRGNAVFVATDQGVFVSRSGNDRWQRLGRGLPLVPVDDIEYDGRNHRLVAATFGRGLYELRTP